MPVCAGGTEEWFPGAVTSTRTSMRPFSPTAGEATIAPKASEKPSILKMVRSRMKMELRRGLTAFIYDHRDAVLPVDLVHVLSKFLSTVNSTSFLVKTEGYHDTPSGLELLLKQSFECDHDANEAGLVIARSTAPDARAVEVARVGRMHPLVNGVGMNGDHVLVKYQINDGLRRIERRTLMSSEEKRLQAIIGALPVIDQAPRIDRGDFRRLVPVQRLEP